MRRVHLGAGMGDSDIAARVTLLGEFSGEKFIEFGAEDTVGDKLALFADLGGHLEERNATGGDDDELALKMRISQSQVTRNRWLDKLHSTTAISRSSLYIMDFFFPSHAIRLYLFSESLLFFLSSRCFSINDECCYLTTFGTS